MNRGTIQKAAAAALSLIMIAGGLPWNTMASYADSSVQNQAEDSVSSESSVSNDAEGENRAPEQKPEEQTESEEKDLPVENSENTEEKAVPEDDGVCTVSDSIRHGRVELKEADGTIRGRAIPDMNYQLATIRILYRQNGKEKEHYIEYNENDGTFSYDISDLVKTDSDASDIRVTATFTDTKVWDGGVDLSWYNPEKKSFQISTPAQLAGLAAIVNGMVDEKETREDQIIDPNRTQEEDGTVKHKYMAASKEYTRLLEQQGGGVEDEVYRLPKARETGIFASDDLYNDMRYRTVEITADINMMGKDEDTGALKNFTCIGGKHAIDLRGDAEDPKVIDTRFQGVLDGRGHTVSIHCNRYSRKGFGYSWNIGLVGYLGGGVDRVTKNAKDCKIDFAKENHPTVRNVVLKGDVLGRRCVGGIVGRIGETNYSCIVENCANYATVRSTDMRGCAGIVGAPWGNSIIRNCYNAGHIAAAYEEVGGIVGSNGYNYAAADIINCFNVGTVENAGVTSGGEESNNAYAGQEIGKDGESGAGYTVENCLYLNPEKADEKKTGFNTGDESKAIVKEVDGISKAEMKSASTVERLNRNGAVFVEGTEHPVLYFEKSGIPADQCSVTIKNPEQGTVTASGASSSVSVPYGSTLELKASPTSGYRLGSFTANGKVISRDFYTVTGDTEISAKFVSVKTAKLIIPTHNSFVIHVARVYSGKDHQEVQETLENGAQIYQGDRLKVTGTLNKNAVPNDVNYEYSGKFGKPASQEKNSAQLADGSSDTLEVTGKGDVTVIMEPKIQKKDWMTQADVSWYRGHEKDKTYTIHNARELAGMALLISDGVDMDGTDFKGKTILLAADIDLRNDDGTEGARLWRTVGNPGDSFRGTFDGQGHTVKNINVNFSNPVYGKISGTFGGLIGVAENAVIKNVKVEGNFLAAAGYSGGIVGRAINTTVENCTTDIQVKNSKETGGIVGRGEGTTVIRNCTAMGNMTGMSELGGIVGSVMGTTSFLGTDDVKIENCRMQGNITGTHQYVGGILGYCVAPVTLVNCRNEGNVSASQNTRSGASDTGACGGIVGTAEGVLTMKRCSNRGKVSGTGYLKYAAGLVGFINKRTSEITDCFSSGDVTAGSRTTAAGFMNMTEKMALAKAAVSNCYAAGAVAADAPESSAVKRDAFIAEGSDDNFKNNYVLENRVTGTKNASHQGVTDLTDAALKAGVSKLGSAYIPDGEQCNSGYPILAWENPSFKADIPAGTLTGIKKSGTTAVLLQWKGVDGAKGYEVYRSTSKTGKYYKICTASGSSTKYTDTKRTPGGWYYYKIRVQKDLGFGNIYSGSDSNILNVRMGLNKPSISSVKNTKKKKAVLKWKKQSGATGIQVYRSTKKKSGFKKVTTTKGSAVSYTNSKLKKKKTYYYKIRSLSKVNGKTVYSAYSAVKSVKIKK